MTLVTITLIAGLGGIVAGLDAGWMLWGNWE